MERLRLVTSTSYNWGERREPFLVVHIANFLVCLSVCLSVMDRQSFSDSSVDNPCLTILPNSLRSPQNALHSPSLYLSAINKLVCFYQVQFIDFGNTELVSVREVVKCVVHPEIPALAVAVKVGGREEVGLCTAIIVMWAPLY